MDIPIKLNFVKRFREIIDAPILLLPLPNINPNIISGLSVITSILFLLFLKKPIIAFIFLLFTLIFDWIDGIIARKYNSTSDEGYIVDVICDRISESLMFIPFFIPWFILFALNSLLLMISIRIGKHISLPLRHAFLIYYLVIYVI